MGPSHYPAVYSTMFRHRNVRQYTWTSPDGKTHNQIDRILIDGRWHSSILGVRSFRGTACNTNHRLVVAKVRERVVVSKQEAQNIDVKIFNLRKLNELDVINPSAWGHLNPSSYCDVGRLLYGVFKLWSKLQRKKMKK